MIRHVLSLVVILCIPPSAMPQDAQNAGVVASSAKENGDVPLLVRIPAELIAKSINCDFEHKGSVNQILLVTTSVGTSHCKGQVVCVVENNPTGVSILCSISGTVESKTCGTNGPAIIDSTALTQYVASKRMTFDGRLVISFRNQEVGGHPHGI